MAEEAFDLDALLDEADRLFAERDTEIVPVVLAGKSVGVRYLPMSGLEWRELTLKHPPRPGIIQDMNLGYNVDGVVSAYPDVALVIGDRVDNMMRPDGEGGQASSWPKVCQRLTKTGISDLAASMWAAHELAPEKLVEQAGKASAGERKKKRS